MAYPHFGFEYDRTTGFGGDQRPDVLIQENTRGRKTVVWHETHEWEHSNNTPRAEVLRENGILLDVNTENCEIHLIRCSPYYGRKTAVKNVQSKQATVSSVLSSFRLILDIFDKVSTAVPQETVTLDKNSTMCIYYINYSGSRTDELKRVRRNIRLQHLADLKYAEEQQPAFQPDAQPGPGHAPNCEALHPAAQNSNESASQSQQQQRPSQPGLARQSSGMALGATVNRASEPAHTWLTAT